MILNKKLTCKCRGQEDPATWAGDIGNSWRTTGDIQDNWKRFLFFDGFFPILVKQELEDVFLFLFCLLA